MDEVLGRQRAQLAEGERLEHHLVDPHLTEQRAHRSSIDWIRGTPWSGFSTSFGEGWEGVGANRPVRSGEEPCVADQLAVTQVHAVEVPDGHHRTRVAPSMLR